jgi:diacylglycerol kinase family enzyme
VRILLVVNSFASSVTARNTVIVHRRLSAQHDVELVETNRRGHAIRFAEDAARRGLDAVIAFGGDGTLNEVATGVAGSTTALGTLPGGSTNVFARTIGLPNDPIAAVDRLAAGLDAGRIGPIGLGRVGARRFCFHTGVGFDAAVVAAVERRAPLKRWFGHPLFIGATVRTWVAGYDRRRPHFALRTGDGRSTDRGFFSAVLNTNPYTFLGNRALDVAPSADLDGALVVVTFTDLRLATVAGAFGRALAGRGVDGSPGVLVWEDVHDLVIESDEPFPHQVDGDHLGDVRRLEFAHEPAAVRLIRPA